MTALSYRRHAPPLSSVTGDGLPARSDLGTVASALDETADHVFASLVDRITEATIAWLTTQAPAAAKGSPDQQGVSSLAALGFGPSMRLRLGQVGVHSPDDLASTSVASLQAALGDISRLIDLESWILAAGKRAPLAAPPRLRR